MPRFSERMGLSPVVIQTDGMDGTLRNAIWNFISRMATTSGNFRRTLRTVEGLTDEIVGLPIQNVNDGDPLAWLLRHFQGLEWPHVYDALEWVVERAET